MPSIQPQQSATSSACAQVTDASPEPFLWTFSQISLSRAWLADSHDANAASVLKLLIFFGLGMIGAMERCRADGQARERRVGATFRRRGGACCRVKSLGA